MGSLRATEVVNHDGLCLIAIESIERQHNMMELGCQLYGRLDPIAIIVCTRDRVYALDMQGRPTAIEQLLEDIPELQDIIAAFKKT